MRQNDFICCLAPSRVVIQFKYEVKLEIMPMIVSFIQSSSASYTLVQNMTSSFDNLQRQLDSFKPGDEAIDWIGHGVVTIDKKGEPLVIRKNKTKLTNLTAVVDKQVPATPILLIEANDVTVNKSSCWFILK